MVRFTYRCLLAALPADTRARIGDDLIDTLVADVGAAPRFASPGRFFANAVDLVSAGLAERRQRGRPSPQPYSPGPLEPLRAVVNDARVALRSFLNTPGLSLVAILSIALGIGLNTTIFSIVNAVVLRPAPGTAPERLVTVFTSSDHGKYSSSSYPDFADLAAQNTTLDGLMAHTLMFAGVERADSTSITVGELVSHNYFEVLGIALAAGPGFQSDADRAGTAPSAVISHRMWQRDFGGRPDTVGRDLTIRGRKYVIAGIAPAGFNGLAAGVSADLWLPVGRVDDVEPVGINDMAPSPTGTHRNERRGQRYLFLTGRLKPGVTIDAARANLQTLMAELERAYPQSNTRRAPAVLSTNAVRIHPDVDSALTPSASVLMAAVGLVLLIACSNIASLLLARATSRAREMAVRVAIGAGRGQIVRQLIVESVLLSFIGGGIGLLLAMWLSGVLGHVQPPMQISVAFDFAPDFRVFLFTFGLALLTGVLFGLAPALRASRPNLVPALKGDAELTRTRRVSMRALLVTGQIAMSMVLLVVAGLLLRSFAAASSADVKFDAGKVVYAAVNTSKQFSDEAAGRRFFEEAERRLSAMPGVTSVARSDRLPFSLTANTSVFEIDGVHGPLSGGGTIVDYANVSSGYFTTLGIPIVRGRAIDDRDRGKDSLKVAVINETAARTFFPGADAVGRRMHMKDVGDYTVVGVSRDHPVRTVGEAPRPFVQLAIDQTRTGFANLIARTDGSVDDLTPRIRRELLAIEPRLAFLGLEPMTRMVDATLFPVRAATVILGSFSALALVLALIGLYGVVSFNVVRHTREIGIRMVLGAVRSRVVGDVLRQSATLVAAGTAIGSVLAATSAQILSGMLVGISAFDPVTYAAAAMTLGAAAFLASVIPARRAASVDPINALRNL